MDTALTRPQLNRWRLAIFAVFTASGLSIATWASRVPAIKLTLGIGNTEVGMLLFGGGVASILGLTLAPVILARLGARRGMLGALLLVALGLVIIGIGTDVLTAYPVVLVGLMCWGAGNGAVDVMMNVEGAAIEKQVNKTILPLFHAFFSVGTVVGAGIGVVALQLGLSVLPHLIIMGVLIAALTVFSVSAVPARQITMDEPGETQLSRRERMSVALSAWREPRTYTLGVIMLGMAFAEGGANDWLPLAVIEGHDGSEAAGAGALAVFSVCMTVGRVAGGPLVDRFGRVGTLRVLSVLAAGGLLLFILAPSEPVMYVAVALWGLGASLGFPLGMSAAADDPARAAARVSAASTIGYVAFLCGPPLLGLISEQIGLLNTFYILVALAVASGLFAPAARPIAGSQVGAGHGHGH